MNDIRMMRLSYGRLAEPFLRNQYNSYQKADVMNDDRATATAASRIFRTSLIVVAGAASFAVLASPVLIRSWANAKKENEIRRVERADTIGARGRRLHSEANSTAKDDETTPKEVVVDAATVNQALASARPGDKIVLRDGTYRDLTILFRPARWGEWSIPITFKPQTRGGVTFTGDSSIVMTGDRLRVDGFRWVGTRPPAGDRFRPTVAIRSCLRCVFSNNVLLDAGPQPTEFSGSVRIDQGSRLNTVMRNRFERLPALGVRVMCLTGDCANTNNTISYNYWLDKSTAICDAVNNKICNNGESVQIGQSVTQTPLYTSVEFNLFENIGDSNEMISCKSARNVFRGNTFRNTDDQLVLRGGEGALVRDNWFLNTRGIRIHDRNHWVHNNYLYGSKRPADNAITAYSGSAVCTHLPVIDLRLTHNTIVASSANGIYIGSGLDTSPSGCRWTDAPKNTLVENNLIVNNAGNAIKDISAKSLYRGNVVWPTAPGKQGFASPGVVAKNPLLKMDANGIFRLQRESTAVNNAGVVPSTMFQDYDIFGRQRPTAKPTIGAEEWLTSLPRYRPLTPSDVGPGSTTLFDRVKLQIQ